MKVLYVVPNPDRIGGVSRSIRRVTEQLEKSGVEVVTFCPDFEAVNGIKRPEIGIMREILEGSQMQEWTQRTIEKITQERPQLVIGYFGSSAAYCATAASKFLNYPVIASMRGSDINRDFFSSFHAHKLKFIAENANAITTVSSEMKHKVEAWLGAKALFIPNSVDKTVFYPRTEGAQDFKKTWGLDHRPVVGLFGEFKSTRGLKLLHLLEEELKKVQVIIVGEVRRNTLNELPEWIKVVPYILDLDTLATAYSACDIILQPSKYDGMPNVVLEAMACEKIVLASAVGGIKDLIKHGSNGYLNHTEDDWIKSIRQVLAHPNPQIGINARSSITTPKQEADSFLKVFYQVLNYKTPYIVN